MIHLITGKPRSGKTYLAVKTLSEFFTYDKDSDYWFPKDEFKSLKIITNIEGLLLPHESLNELCEKMKLSIPAFFTKPVQEKISLKHPFIVYVLDEAQQFFPDNFRGNDTRFYFEYHGHFGHTIYLLTQDKYRIWRGLSSLAEYETRAVKKSLSIFGEIKYNEVSSGEIIGRKALKPKKDIFNLYVSEKVKQPFKAKSPVLKYLLIPLLLLTIPLYYSYKSLSGWILKNDDNERKVESMEKSNAIGHPSNKTDVALSNHYPQKLRVTMDSIKVDNLVKFVRHPITNELCPIAEIPYELHFDGRNVYAYMNPIEFAQYIEAKNLQDTPAEDKEKEVAPRSRPTWAGLPWGGGS